jgi:hypothetical protein
MSFGDTYRIIALAPELVEPLFTQLTTTYGELMPDGSRLIKTIGAHWDDVAHTRKRAADHPTTITGTPLTDGRVAYRALWQSDLMAEFDLHGIEGVEELSEEQFAALLPQPEEP